jgi:hypothetical protein
MFKSYTVADFQGFGTRTNGPKIGGPGRANVGVIEGLPVDAYLALLAVLDDAAVGR